MAAGAMLQSEDDLETAVDQEPSGARPIDAASLREGALSFVNGACHGWDVHALMAWMDRHLLRHGRLRTRHPYPRVVVREANVGLISYGHPSGTSSPALYLPQTEVPRLVMHARAVVVAALEGMLRPSPDDRFVQAAIYDGRVARGRRAGRVRRWQVMLTEQHSLSDQVLALFAADLLTLREPYEQDLVVCEVCSTVAFWPQRTSRRGCSEHPDGLIGEMP